IVAQLLSAAINLSERDTALVRVMGMQPAQRIADIVRLLDASSPEERARIVGILNVPPLVVSLDHAPMPEASASMGDTHAAMFAAVLRAALGDDRPIRVAMTTTPPPWASGPGRMRGRFAADGPPGMHPFSPGGFSMLTQVRLQDRTWASFDTRVAPATAGLPWRLLLTLATLLAAVLLLSYVAVRWVTRPLGVLAVAADQLGRDIHRPPLPEDGPLEVGRAARAFNTMQASLIRFIDERTRLLTAMSHDLKTPLTRMRLRAELLEDAALRDRFEKDLVEMETMVTQTLDFMRGLANRKPAQPTALMALLESLRADNEAMGRTVTIEGSVTKPLMGEPQLLRRCISNLVDNATTYGRQADIRVEEDSAGLKIHVRDHGPGIPEVEIEKVFEPFYRLESSRSRETGGTGLGLSIARSIARGHGGDVRLRNHEHGGLEAILSLAWRHAPVE
ncbi:MAG: ATP-binding protein, partial [Casimicrobiaceae bacterium]